jgi:threonine synthase
MTTVDANVHNLAIEGRSTLQDLVKMLFLPAFRSATPSPVGGELDELGSAVARSHMSSWARRRRPVSYAVPTGNFGNVFSGCGRADGCRRRSVRAVGSDRNDI